MRIIVSADSSKLMGFGHITRALTLARALEDAGAEVLAVGQGMGEGVAISPSFQNLTVLDPPAPTEGGNIHVVLGQHPDAVVVDGYHFSEEFFHQVSLAGIPYAVIDDNGETRASEPVLVHNQNPHATPDLYKNLSNQPLLLLGLEYALLRPEVGQISKITRHRSDVVVVGLGGTDSANLTWPLATGLLRAGFRVRVNERFWPLFSNVSMGDRDFLRLDFFSSPSFLDTLSSAAVAVLGAGTSLWEANAVGTPAVGVVVAENQRNPARVAHSEGYVSEVINHLDSESEATTVGNVVNAVNRVLVDGPQKLMKRINTSGSLRAAKQLLHEFALHIDNSR